jgi:hypothetical protein
MAWRKTIDIKPILQRDQENIDPAYIAKCGKEIADLIRANTTGDEQADNDLSEALDTLETIDPHDDEALEQFNDALDILYDWADAERVWLGI